MVQRLRCDHRTSFKDRTEKTLSPESQTRTVDGPVLIVEDNFLVALDIESFLKELGFASCVVASTVPFALHLLAAHRPCLALVDVDLGAETSEAVARELDRVGVPFLFLTGYEDGTTLTRQFPHVTVLAKPFTMADFDKCVTQLAPR
jgi:CheY-like chemotaxis protein